MNNACPSCGAIYNISAKDVGRRVACKKCKAALIIDETGMRLDGTGELPQFTPPTPGESIAIETSAESPTTSTRNATDAVGSRLGIVKDWPAVLLATGLFLVTIFHFFPRIDVALIASRKADVQVGAIEDATDDRDTIARKANDAEKEARRKRSDDWQKTKQRLEDRAALAQYDAERALPWNYRGQLFGYALLIVAGVGLLTSDSHARRVVGGTLLILLFMTITNAGVRVSIGG